MLQVTSENSTPAHQVHLLKKKAWIAQQPKEDDGATTTTYHQEDARRLSSSSTQNLLHSPSFSAAGVGVGVVVVAAAEAAAAAAAVQCTSSSCSGSCISGLPARLMEETSCCGTSFAVDCTLSLGSATSRPDIPTRLSRAGSPEQGQDLTWPRSSSVRSEQADPPMRRTCDQEKSEQGISWNGSCGRGDPNGLPEDYPPATVPVREARSGDTKARLGSNAWSRLCVQSSKDETVGRPKGLLGMLEKRAYDSGRQSWLPNYLASNGAGGDGNGSSRSDRCMQDGSSLVRVCAHCGTSKTPLWRNGPQGPKSLCNACGIRFKKAGRRLAASANAELQGHSGVVTATKSGKRKLSEEKAQQYWVYPPDAASRKRSRNVFLRPSDSILSSGSCVTWQPFLSPAPQTSHQRDRQASPRPHSQDRTLLQMGAFSNDEEEGAVLLMALSCGLVHA